MQCVLSVVLLDFCTQRGTVTLRSKCTSVIEYTGHTTLHTHLHSHMYRIMYCYLLLLVLYHTQMMMCSFLKSHGKDAATSTVLQQLKLTGLGDPSGCGEGFSYLQKPPDLPQNANATTGDNGTDPAQTHQLDQLAYKKVSDSSSAITVLLSALALC